MAQKLEVESIEGGILGEARADEIRRPENVASLAG